MFLFRYGVNYINLAVTSDIYIMPRITMTKIWNQSWIFTKQTMAFSGLVRAILR